MTKRCSQRSKELQPACVDTGMSYEERVAKREQEMEALKDQAFTNKGGGSWDNCPAEQIFLLLNKYTDLV